MGSGAGFGDPLPSQGLTPGGPACFAGLPPGSVLASFASAGGTQVAVDASGNIFYSADSGIAKVTSAGVNVYTFGFGSVFALDSEGDAFVAGAFTGTIDLGHGFVLTAQGNVDVFVAKLSPRGVILSAQALGQCGDGVESIAVARDGRVAVSGSAMGTVVVDASGALVFQLAYDGQVAFDSTDNLFVGGSFTGTLALDSAHALAAGSPSDVDAFIAEVDATGNFVRSVQLGDGSGETAVHAQAIVSLAINVHDELAVLGTFDEQMDLFGTPLREPAELPSGHPLGSFDVAFDDTLAVKFAQEAATFYEYNPPGAIAIDAAGEVAISSNVTSEEYFPNGHPTLVKLEPSGLLEFAIDEDPIEGYGLGVAFDACGDVVWASNEHAVPLNPIAPVLRILAQ